MSIAKTDWAHAVAELQNASDIALACHIGPDGDALGSMLGLGLALHRRGVAVIASWGSEPFLVPRHYAFLPGQDLLKPAQEFPSEPGLMMTFDTPTPARLGTLEPNARKADRLIVVDHHASNEPFGTINLIDPQAAATAVLAYDLIRALGIDLDREIALCLYTGILTDTGSFKYRNTSPRVHEIAADLLGYDIEHDVVARTVYDTHPVGFLRLAADALQRAEVRPDVSLIWTWVGQEDLRRHGVEPEDTEALIDLIRTADVTDIACVMKEGPDGAWKGSLRSKGGNDVAAIAESFGGGGHALAAGFTAPAGAPAAIEAITEQLRRA